jgi:5-methyltetrahydrofolate--homocysteine methyltransferase
LSFTPQTCVAPAFTGRRAVDLDLAELAALIDWTFFFHAWELKGLYPSILNDPNHGHAARELFEHAQTLLRRVMEDGSLTAKAVYGFWPACSEGDDLVLFADEGRTQETVRFPMLRQQGKRPGKPSDCLADLVAPADAGVPDHVAAFAVTAGLGAEELAAAFEAEHDDYNAFMIKALADRLAEAAAEWMHRRVRLEWYAPDEDLELEGLIKERYRGIRPAFGYPACPDHQPKRALFDLLDAPAIGMALTESCAMTPAASVSGLCFGHPEARYFNVGRLGRDQVEDYARRCGTSVESTESWLREHRVVAGVQPVV